MGPLKRTDSDYEEFEAEAALRAYTTRRKRKNVRFYRFVVSKVHKLPELKREDKQNMHYSGEELREMKEEAAPKANKPLKDYVAESTVNKDNVLDFEDGFSQMFE
jgi:hypothetical protein